MHVDISAPSLHGILLTGGRSSRMGTDKAMQTVGGVAIGRRVALALTAVAGPVIVVGPHRELGSEAVLDEGKGPLAAMLAGWERLIELGCTGPVFLAGCDLPFLSPEIILYLAGRLGSGSAEAAVPELDSRAQPLAACFAPGVLPIARDLIASGKDAMKDLLAALNVDLVPEAHWGAVASTRVLFDVDTPEALQTARQWTRSRAR